ncbi:unnamed protein product [Psylliodes chrysocephalus]|uniref:E3 ubiquitin-protein ligase n=1 Tax=Psylliodes chrysocephalus TaxID=3402493 RepID=A0A9P0CPQ2_9CUCU|nr:unnamed protein product [Psylliodes chrysocephala]
MSHLQYVTSNNLCDYCHKSLSVTPVKVYPNRRIKCGRCSTSNDEEEDNGVNSMYNQIATRIFFECINKFDGCTKLLQSSEVVKHEKTCLSKTFVCPICLKEMFTFLIIPHFKLNHPESLLEKPNFQITDLKNIEKIFLYQLESDLLFVNFRDTSDSFADDFRRFSLNVRLHLGKKDYIQNLKVDFFEKNIDILDKTINTSGSTSVTYNLMLNITHESKLLVMFHLICVESKSVVVKVVKHKVNKIKENTNLKLLHQNNSVSQVFHKQLGEYLKTLLFEKRDIFPNEKFKNVISDLVITEKATLSFTKSREKITITFGCHVCSLLNYWCNQSFVHLIGHNGHYYIECVGCDNLYINKRKNIVKKNCITLFELTNIMFFCVWDCGTFCNIDELYTHERNCLKQICQKCPVKSCFYYFKLYEIEYHIRNEHSLVMSPQINWNEKLIIVHLDTSKSAKEYIMLIWYICVLVKFKWEKANWTISFTCELPGTQIKARIFDKNKKAISTIIESGSIPHNEEILLHLRCLVTNKEN